MKHLLFSIVLLLSASVFFNASLPAKKQTLVDPWTAKQLLDPAELAKTLNDPKSAKPVIYNIGVAANIKTAILLGSTSEKENIEKLKKEVLKHRKNKSIVIYCGCCKLDHCPNIRPAFNALKSLGYTNFKVLNMPTDLDMDWINKGYPMQ